MNARARLCEMGAGGSGRGGMDWRALRMGLPTLLGLRRRGVFIPYRYADSVPRPPDPAAQGYPAIADLFARHESGFAQVLDSMSSQAPALAAMDGPAPAPRIAQDWFPRLDAAAAFALVRARPPRRIVEVGSGHSTRFLARAASDSGAATAILCIDPAPRATLPPGVAHRAEVLSRAHLPAFAALEAGDVAFFDSSHLLLPHGDVDLILNVILPALRPGVLVHVHDVFLPDPYPAEWTWRGYAEQCALVGWLLGGAFRPVFSSRWAATRMTLPEPLEALPLRPGVFESSLWMERV